MYANKITLGGYIAYLQGMYKRYGNISITQLKHIERNRKKDKQPTKQEKAKHYIDLAKVATNGIKVRTQSAERSKNAVINYLNAALKELEDLNIKKVEPIKGLSESTYNYLVSHCKRKIEQCKYSPSLLLSYNEHRIFLELLERVGRDFIEKEE